MHGLRHVLGIRLTLYRFLRTHRKSTNSLLSNHIRLLCQSLSQAPRKEEHLIRTASQYRQPIMYEGIIHKIEDPSEEVRTISVKISCPGLTFKAGQWVDFYIPGVQPVVGFSMTSPPHLAETKGILDLAVRYSVYPPTYWIHRQCKLGDAVTIRVGGEFFYDPEPGTNRPPQDLLLIGGGVGINPLVSIAQHYAHLLTSGKLVTAGPVNKMVVLYSAKNQRGLVFRDEFRDLKNNIPSIGCHFFATNETSSKDLPSDTAGRRINLQDIETALSVLNKDNVVCYVCGPSSMTDEVVELLSKLGLPPQRVCFEKWW